MRRASESAGRMWVLSLALGAGAIALAWLLRSIPRYSADLHVPWWALAIMFCLAEIHVVHIQFRRETETFSLNEIPLVLGLFFASPVELVAAQALGAGAALIIHRRQPALKVTFNLGQLCIGASLAAIVFRNVASPADVLGTAEIAGAFAATTTAIVFGVVAVIAAISFSEGEVRARMIGRVLGFGFIGTIAGTALTLTAVGVMRADLRSAWLLFIPAAALVAAYSGYSSFRRQHETLSQLYEATHELHSTLDMKPVLHSMLAVVREMLRADVATVTLFPEKDGEPAFEASIRGDRADETLSAVTLDPTAGVWARVASEGQGILLERPISNERLREHFAAQGLKDAVVVPLYGAQGVAGTVLVGNRLGDVETFTETDLKLLETLVAQASVSLENARLVTRLQDSLADMQQLNRLKDEFLAAVSHDLRTPVAAIMASAGALLSNGMKDSERNEFMDLIVRQGRRLRDLIDDLLMTARLESGTVEPVLSRVVVAEVCNSVIQAFSAQDTGHRLRVDVPPLPVISCDEDALNRILTNLVSNAVKYSRPRSEIEVAARLEGPNVLFAVSNEGAPIPESHHELIFDRFFRMERSSNGTGLGLYVCRKLAETLGGKVWLERSDENGSVFMSLIPMRPQTPSNTRPQLELSDL